MSRSSNRAKVRVNAVLTRLTGYHLAKTAPPSVYAQLDAANGRLSDVRRRLERTGRELDQARSRLARSREDLSTTRTRLRELEDKQRNPPLPQDFDEQMCEAIEAVRGRTMTGPVKLFTLISAVRYIVEHDVPGAFVECGVWRGGSMQAVARELVRLGVSDRDLHLFDTFEGMPPPTDADVRWDGRSAADLLAANDKSRSIWATASLEDVQEGFAAIDYPAERIHYVQGRVEQTVPEHVPEHIALLRLDTDWYESSRHELDHMYDRLVPGGVLLLDDYGYWEGQRRATDEWLARTKEPLMLFGMGAGRAALKPRR
jgi:hypothetical protein